MDYEKFKSIFTQEYFNNRVTYLNLKYITEENYISSICEYKNIGDDDYIIDCLVSKFIIEFPLQKISSILDEKIYDKINTIVKADLEKVKCEV